MNSPVNCLLNGGDKGPKKFFLCSGTQRNTRAEFLGQFRIRIEVAPEQPGIESSDDCTNC